MAIKNVVSVIQLRNGPQSAWDKVAQKYIPKAGEACVVTEGKYKGQVKFGDGVTVWGELPFSGAISSDNKSIFVVDGKIEIAGYAEALVGQTLRKGENGLEWFTLDANSIGAVPKIAIGTNGKSYVFNETDGGGVKFVNNNGLESFVGVHDGSGDGDLSGMAVQIYADKKTSDGKYVGSRINVYQDKICYVSQGEKEAGVSAKNEDQEIATVGDVNEVKKEAVMNTDTLILDGGNAE